MDRFSVPGRNGDIIVMQDAWENVEQIYNVWGNIPGGNATDIGYSLADWLFKDGYQRLEDSYDTDHYRKAVFLGPLDIENVLRRRGRAEIVFDCDPRRFLKTGEATTTITAQTNFNNPTKFTAKPVITVHGSGSGAIAGGGNTLTISNITNGMVIDCENQNAYLGTTNLNADVSGAFPVLLTGIHSINFSGGITSLDVVPNWWTL